MPEKAKSPAPPSRFISKQEAAGIIHMSVQFIDKLFDNGHLKKYHFGRSVRIIRAEFQQWVEKNEVRL
jgi:excisionase family DNA binding protein